MGDGQYLKSSDPGYDSAEIEACFAALYGEDGIAEYEHGQWWIVVRGSGRTYSVVDAAGAPDRVCGGLSFEEV
jgi:hypothetical protein